MPQFLLFLAGFALPWKGEPWGLGEQPAANQYPPNLPLVSPVRRRLMIRGWKGRRWRTVKGTDNFPCCWSASCPQGDACWPIFFPVLWGTQRGAIVGVVKRFLGSKLLCKFLGVLLPQQGQARRLWPWVKEEFGCVQEGCCIQGARGSSRKNFFFLRDSLQQEPPSSSFPQGNPVPKSAKRVRKSAGETGSWGEGQEEREAVGFLDDLRTIWLLLLIWAFAKETVAAVHKRCTMLQRGRFNESNNFSCDSSQKLYLTSTTRQNPLSGFSPFIRTRMTCRRQQAFSRKKNKIVL